MRTRGQGHYLTFDQELLHIDDFKHIFLASGPVEIIKFYVESPRVEETKICSKHPGHMTNMASMPIYGKNL